jgi:1,4-dihydroxy-2-naphthoate octaprenyltransferase
LTGRREEFEHREMSTVQRVSVNPSSDIRPNSWRAWRQALRLPSLSATIAPFLVGAAYAWATSRPDPFLLGLILVAAIACQTGANLTNDYFDHRRGVDTAERPGSSRVIQFGLLSPGAVRRGMIVAFVTATIFGILIVAQTGIGILLLALASLAVAVLYTAGPKPLGYVALGEVAVFLAMGVALVAGSVLALTGTITVVSLVIALPTSFLITAILHVNNMRDVERDQAAGKRTLAMLFGRRRSNLLFGSLIAAAYVGVPLIALLAPIFWPVLLATITLPRGIALTRSVAAAASEPAFSRAMRGTNRLLIEVGVLLAAGLLIGAAIGPPSIAL